MEDALLDQREAMAKASFETAWGQRSICRYRFPITRNSRLPKNRISSGGAEAICLKLIVPLSEVCSGRWVMMRGLCCEGLKIRSGKRLFGSLA